MCATFPEPGEDISHLPRLTAVAVYPKGQPAFPVVKQMSDQIMDQRISDICQWYRDSEEGLVFRSSPDVSVLRPGPRTTAQTATLSRINTIKGEPVDHNTEAQWIRLERLNSCDN